MRWTTWRLSCKGYHPVLSPKKPRRPVGVSGFFSSQKEPVPRFLYTCSYDGAPYRGWQSQRGGETIQDTLEAAFFSITGERMRIAAAGRTDAGVHAYAQCFHADVPTGCRLTAEHWCAALNAHLPPSIRVLSARAVADDFHARFQARGKVYEYLLLRSPVQSPFLHGRVWHLPTPLDETLLEQTLHLYEGRHDFRRFAARRGNEPKDPPEDYYCRTLTEAACRREGDLLRLSFRGDGFMYRMVRLLTGTAVQVARGKLPPAQLEEMLRDVSGATTRFCAPAGGLYLRKVLYDGREEA